MKRYYFAAILLFISFSTVLSQNSISVNSSNALENYLSNGDNTYRWIVEDSARIKGLMVYKLVLTSQTWQSVVCKHTQFIIIPKAVKHSEALMFITGGANKENLEPEDDDWMKDETLTFLIYMARLNKAVTSLIMQVPVQPLYGGLSEDPLILKTLYNFKETRDYTWPLLFQMTKTVIRAMDAVTEFTGSRIRKPSVERFVVTGGSKRGWTTWLVGAMDKRVVAMAPMVFNILNMPVSMRYQKETMGDFSVLIKPYADLGLAYPEQDKLAQEIVDMIDPYSYRDRICIPKLLVTGTKDYFWATDAERIYVDSIRGENHLLCAPNVKHNLGDKKWAIYALNAFFNKTINDKPYNQLNEKVHLENGKIVIEVKATSKGLKGVSVWSAEASGRDFRTSDFTETIYTPKNKKHFTLEIPLPASGYKAFYVADKYKMPYKLDYHECSGVYVVSKDQLYTERPAAFEE